MNINIRNLKKTKGDRLVIDIGYIAFEGGKIHTLVGPNGVGKTTLLRMIAGLEEADDGSIAYDEQTIDDTIRRRVTYVGPQAHRLDMSCFDSIALPLKLRGVGQTDRKKRVQRVMEELQITDLSHKSNRRLSSGEAQKVAFARAIVFEPDLLLLDEPTANADPTTTEAIESALLSHQERTGCTVIAVTHHMHQAERIGSRHLLLERQGITDHGKQHKHLVLWR